MKLLSGNSLVFCYSYSSFVYTNYYTINAYWFNTWQSPYSNDERYL